MIWLGVIVILAMAALGAPLFAVLMGAAMLGFYSADIDLAIIAIELYRIVDTPLLVALPLFTFSGYLLSESNTSTRLVNLMQSLFGWLPSGLAIVAFIACSIFTALTGASGVTIVALGALLLPALKQAGFADKYSLGLVTTSGSLGLLLVPSVPLILYGVIAQQLDVGESFTIVELFIAGVVPLCLMLSLLILWTLWHHRGGVIPRFPSPRATCAPRCGMPVGSCPTLCGSWRGVWWRFCDFRSRGGDCCLRDLGGSTAIQRSGLASAVQGGR